jgi:DNA-binding response OmpR family regulator
MNKSTHILLAEDEPNFGTVLKSYLSLANYTVDWCKNGKEAYSKLCNTNYDLCILDVMMPEMDGFTLAQEIRKKDLHIPIIFLTAKTLKEDVLKGFKIGADDYLTKPFDSDILLEKLKVLLKRKSSVNNTSTLNDDYLIGDFIFHPATRKLTHFNETFVLSPKESALLLELSKRLNNVMSRSEALKLIWNEDNYFTARSMDVYIAKLRKYLMKDSKIKIINIHGNGFQLLVEH